MAIYVMSDIHGHVRALEEVLDLASPGDDDEVYVLGDMVDRGPAPVDVIRRVRSLPNVRVLMGNHEMMLLDVLLDTGEMDGFTWALNGGFATATGLDVLDRDEYAELIDWMRGLPLFAVAETESRRYILTHAGIDAMEARGYLATAGAAARYDVAPAAGNPAVDARGVLGPTDRIRGQGWHRSRRGGGPYSVDRAFALRGPHGKRRR